jgi:hypothetical protein
MSRNSFPVSVCRLGLVLDHVGEALEDRTPGSVQQGERRFEHPALERRIERATEGAAEREVAQERARWPGAR